MENVVSVPTRFAYFEHIGGYPIGRIVFKNQQAQGSTETHKSKNSAIVEVDSLLAYGEINDIEAEFLKRCIAESRLPKQDPISLGVVWERLQHPSQ